MARTLIRTYCISNSNNSAQQNHLYYDPALRAQGLPPVVLETTTVISCTQWYLPDGQELDRYCAVDNMGAGVLRVVTSLISEPVGYVFTDSVSAACNGTCDLTVIYGGTVPTSSPTTRDGTIVVEATSTKPPIDCYIATLGLPTSFVHFNPGVLPAHYQFTYQNVGPGTYAAQLQDNGNCQRSSDPLTVALGGVPGTGGVGMPSAITWFKFEYVNPEPSTIFGGIKQGKIQGYAWNKVTRQGYYVPPITLTFPIFNEYFPDYAIGTIVGYVRPNETIIRYYRALKLMQTSMFVNNSGKLPYPDENGLRDGWWERLHDGVHDNVQPLDVTYFDPQPTLGGPLFYRTYADGHVVRYGYAEFYAAKHEMKGRDYRVTGFPYPANKQDNNDWKYLPNYSFFHYAAAEPTVIDQFTLGTTSTTVRFHVLDPFAPNYVPTTSRYFKNADSDYILFDDTTQAIEAVRGDLVIVDVIKNDVDVQGAENGSVAVLATSPSLPIKFHLRNGVRPGYVQDNYTGIYESLSPGHYVVDVTDAASRYKSVEFDITDGYRERWNLTFDDQDGTPLELRIFQRDWAGAVTPIIGTGEPVVLSWDSGSDPGGYLPEAVGANLDFSLRTEIVSQFLDTALNDDRFNRVDYYRGGKLQFRGYIDSTSYEEALLGPGQEVKLKAVDGLGQLNDTKFINFFGERQVARTSMLSIILKCLSFADVNLPVVCGLNLRDQLMTATGDPLLEAYVHRNAYDKSGDESDAKYVSDDDLVDCRTVVNAILRLFNAMLFQADGCWKIISLSEVDADFDVRVWSPAGTLLPVGTIDTTPTPLRILPSTNATGPNELYWVDRSQLRTIVAAAKIVNVKVKPQLEANLLDNGYFVDWDSTNTRPQYWSIVGRPTVARAKGDKVHEYVLKFSNYTQAYNTSDYVLSPGIPHLTGQDEDSILLKFEALLEPTVQTTTEMVVTTYFQVLCDGAAYGSPITVDVSTTDKKKEFTAYLPTGMPGRSVRIRVLNPVAKDALSVNSTLKFNYIALSIQPGQYDWSNFKLDHKEAENPLPVTTGIRLDDLEIVHADLPLLPSSAGIGLPPKKMDVYAWRHAISLEDYTATIRWKRPKDPAAYPLLDMVGFDRIELRTHPSRQVTGTVRGPGINRLRQGLMLDMPGQPDEEGKYVIISVSKNERLAEADITIRRIVDGYYGGAVVTLPNGVRTAKANGKLGYRVATDAAGDQGYRVAAV
jgi:hypothetical protein